MWMLGCVVGDDRLEGGEWEGSRGWEAQREGRGPTWLFKMARIGMTFRPELPACPRSTIDLFSVFVLVKTKQLARSSGKWWKTCNGIG